MGGRPSKISPSKLGLRSQVFKENSAVLSNLPSNLPVTPFMPRTSGHAEAPLNGFITPRSHGRSAIYSMARTPYSRIHQSTLKVYTLATIFFFLILHLLRDWVLMSI